MSFLLTDLKLYKLIILADSLSALQDTTSVYFGFIINLGYYKMQECQMWHNRAIRGCLFIQPFYERDLKILFYIIKVFSEVFSKSKVYFDWDHDNISFVS